MKRFQAIRADILIVAGFLILPLLLYGPVTIGGQTMVPADNLFQWAPWKSAAERFGATVPENALLSDLILENYVWKQFIRQSLASGELPLWNPYLFAGTPFLATGQHSAYYPFSILFLILPLAKAYGWFTLSQLWLAGVFGYWFGRILGQQRFSAALVGLVYQGCGFMLVSAAVFPMIVAAAVWLPLLLGCIEMVLRNSRGGNGSGRTLPWMVLGAVALGMQILAGHVEITYYTLLVMAAYAGWRLLWRWQGAGGRGQGARSVLRPSLWLGGMVVVGLMLGAIQLIPLYEVGQVNFRQGVASLEEVRGWAFPARRAVTLLLPDFYGNPADHGYRDALTGEWAAFTVNVKGELNPNGAYSSSWGIKNYVEGGIYLGILPLLLAGLGIWSWRGPRTDEGVVQRRRRRIQIAFFLLLSLFSLAFIFGTPLYALIYYLPFISQLHSPFRWVFPLSLCVAALAGFGMDYLLRGVRGRGQGVRRFGTLILAVGLLVLAGLFLTRVLYGQLEPIIERVFMGLALAPEAFSGARAFYSYQFWQVLHLGLMLVGAGAVLIASQLRTATEERRRMPLWAVAALVIVGFDLLWVGYGFNASVDPALLSYKPEMARFLEEQPGLWRFTTFDSKGGKPFNANAGWFFGFQDVRGYDSIIPRQYTNYMGAIEAQNELPFNRIQPIGNWESLNSPLLDLLGVRYVISEEQLALPKLQLVWEGEGVQIYENLAAMPRAFTLPQAATAVVAKPLAEMRRMDPRQYVIIDDNDWSNASGQPLRPGTPSAATVIAYGNNEVVVEASVEEPVWLILADSYSPGWKAFIESEDGEQETPVVKVNGNFRGIQLPAGDWTVRFRYSPLSFRLGGLISFMGAAILLFTAVAWAWRRVYQPTAELGSIRSVAKNSLAPMILNLFNRGIDFVFAAFYLRLLGPADAGSYATAIAIAGWFEIISNFGLNTLVIREVSQDRTQATHYLVNTTILRIGTSLLGLLPILVTFWGIDLDPNTTAAILLLMLGMIFSGMGQGVTGLFYAFEEAEWPAAIATVTTILKVAFGVVALLLGYGFIGLAAVSIIVNLITLAILLAVAFSRYPLAHGAWRVAPGLQRAMLVSSYPLMLNHLLAVVFFQIDVPLLNHFRDETEVGWYNSAYKWINAFNVIPAFFTFALFPVVARQVKNRLDEARRTVRLSLKLLALVALPLAAVTTLLAEPLIGLLGGAAFLPDGAIALRIIVWSIPFGWLNSITNYVLIALGQERRLTVAFIGGVAFNVIANLIFLERYGYVAAATITILSELVLLAFFGLTMRERMPGIDWLRLLWRPAMVTAAMVIAMWLGAQLHLMLGLLLGLLVYPTGLWLMQVFGNEERYILQSLLPAPLAARLQQAS